MGVSVEYNVKKALEKCDIANVLRIQLERQHKPLFSSLREYALYYGVNKKMLDSLGKDILILHPGPINRGVEIDSDVADCKQSIILDQVENGVAIRMAVVYLLSGNREMSL
jgi:aspartate carbamoyltransferase catalytic subunit